MRTRAGPPHEPSTRARARLNESQVPPASIMQAALADIDARAHAGLTRIVREHTFVGLLAGCTALLQAGSKLYMVDVSTLSRDLAYQLAVRRAGQHAPLALEPPVVTRELVMMALEAQEAAGTLTDADGSKVRMVLAAPWLCHSPAQAGSRATWLAYYP
jgi:DNA mismatch repair protein Mlh1 C-terminus